MRTILALACLLCACHDDSRGRDLVIRYGCAACHELPDVHARGGGGGLVGPPLTGFARRSYIGGRLPNTPENLVQWIQNPHAVDPRTAMPTLGLTEKEARDVAAYLYTLD
jgi:cytochrome c1